MIHVAPYGLPKRLNEPEGHIMSNHAGDLYIPTAGKRYPGGKYHTEKTFHRSWWGEGGASVHSLFQGVVGYNK